MAPQLDPSFLRALLLYVGAWDPSEHALLSRKHFLAALRGEPPPASLQPPPPGALAAAGGAAAEGEEVRHNPMAILIHNMQRTPGTHVAFRLSKVLHTSVPAHSVGQGHLVHRVFS